MLAASENVRVGAGGRAHRTMWLIRARKFEWELTGLVALLVVLAAAVAHAAGYRLPNLSSPAPLRAQAPSTDHGLDGP